MLIQGVLNFMVGGRGEQGTEEEVKHILQHSNLMSRSTKFDKLTKLMRDFTGSLYSTLYPIDLAE